MKISRHIWCYVLNHHVWIDVSFKSRCTTVLGLFKRGTADWTMNKTIKAAIMLNCTYITDGDGVRQRNWWSGTNALCKFVCVNLSVKRQGLSSESLINSMSMWLTARPGRAPSNWLVSLFKEQSHVLFLKQNDFTVFLLCHNVIRFVALLDHIICLRRQIQQVCVFFLANTTCMWRGIKQNIIVR